LDTLKAPRFFRVVLPAILLLSASRALFGQFSTPYDPDFAAQLKLKSKNSSISEQSQKEPSSLQLFISEHRFLLLDRPDPSHLFEVPTISSPTEVEDFFHFEDSLKAFVYTPDEFLKARDAVESPPVALPSAEFNQEGLVINEPPKPTKPELVLPNYGTSLSVTGRKVIGFNFNEQRYLKNQNLTGRAQTTTAFNIAQQMQLRMQGKIGPHIAINVNYDDTRPNQHQDIYVTYTGNKNDTVQNVAFGDINLSLPATEFVSYDKQVFGIRADVQHNGFKATVIGSRTQGTTHTKQFVGNTQFVATDITDTSYIRHTDYDLTFGNPARLPLRAGSEQVYLANLNQAQVNVNSSSMTVNDLAVQSAQVSAEFAQLSPGQDYTIDYIHGILTFRVPVQLQSVVAINFIDASGNSLSVETSTGNAAPCGPSIAGTNCFNAPKIIKTQSDIPISTTTTVSTTTSEVGYDREMLTFYNIGQQQIVPDNGQGNFFLQVINQQRQLVGPSLNPPQVYPQTIQVHFQRGFFQLLEPFAIATDSAIPDPQLYSPNPISERLIHIEYSFRLATFTLEPNITPLSEIVLVDNVKYARNVDYFIDYQSGFITFFNPARISANSQVDITYDVEAAGGSTAGDQALLGARASYDFNSHFTIGSTVLYQTGTKSPITPDVTDLSQSLLVYDANANLHDIKFGKHFEITSLTAEVAQSKQDMDLNTDAIVDNMEGISQEDDAGTLDINWVIAANPAGQPADPNGVSWVTENVPTLQINPRAQANPQDSQTVLDLSYNFSQSASSEVSIAFPFSLAGNDFSHRIMLEVVVLGDNSGNQIDFHLGKISDDADGTGGTTITCPDGRIIYHAAKTEDLACTGVLAPGEDIGWTYSPIGLHSTVYGANNGILNSEDFNENQMAIYSQDFTGGDFGYIPDPNNPNNAIFPSITDGNSHNMSTTGIDFGSGSSECSANNNQCWQTFQIPLNISSATASLWTAIRQIRVSVRHASGGASTGIIKFAKIAVVGNTWLPGQATDPATNSPPVANESLFSTPINNVDDPGYIPIYNAGGVAEQVFTQLYGSVANLQQQSNTQNVQEQALELNFSNMTISPNNIYPNTSSAVVTTTRIFPQSIDISQHHTFNFLLYGNAQAPLGSSCTGPGTNGNPNCTDHTFFLRVGNNTNFFEVDVPISFVGWAEVTITQAINSAQIAYAWQSVTITGPPGTQQPVLVSSGIPSLQQVGEIVTGIRRTGSVTAGGDNIATSGIVYLDEIYLSGPIARVGNADDIAANFVVPNWASFGLKTRSVSQNFQTPVTVVSNQSNEQNSAYLNFTRLSFLPVTMNVSNQVTDTPNTSLTGTNSNLVNLLQAGKVTTWNGTLQANLNLNELPHVGFNYADNNINYASLDRTDNTQTYQTTLQYTVPTKSAFLPHTINANGTYSTYKIDYNSPNLLTNGGLSVNNTVDTTRGASLNLNFIPWTGSSFNPNYQLTNVEQQAQNFTGATQVDSQYELSQNQTTGFASNWHITSWLTPSVNYSMNTIENANMAISTFVVNGSTTVYNQGQTKTINRMANGSISLPINIDQIFPSTKLFKSMSIISGYQLQDGDVWNNVTTGFNDLSALWIRSEINPNNPGATLTSLTERDTYNSTQRWNPFSAYGIMGRLSALKTFSFTNNYVLSVQKNDITGTQSKTIETTLPDIVLSMSQIEKLLYSESWMSNTQLDVRYQAHKTNNVGQTINTDSEFQTNLRALIRNYFDTTFTFDNNVSASNNLLVGANTQHTAHQDATLQTTFRLGDFTFTPKTTYTHDTTLLGTGIATNDTTIITPSVLIRGDFAMPGGLRIPIINKILYFVNRLIWTNTISYAYSESPVTQANNSRTTSATTSADYQIAKNLRLTLNGSFSMLQNPVLAVNNYISFQLGSQMVFQF
jgi:hypothetical protein